MAFCDPLRPTATPKVRFDDTDYSVVVRNWGVALIRSSLSCSDKSMMGKMMTSDDKTSPAPKNGTDVKKEAAAKKDEGQVKDKTTSDADLSKAEGGEKTANSPAGVVGARVKNRFRKPIKITGTRFTRKRKRRSGKLDQRSRYGRSAARAGTIRTKPSDVAALAARFYQIDSETPVSARSFNSPRTALTPQTPLRCGTSRYRATLRRLDSPTRSAIANVAPNRQGGGSTAPKATIAVLGRMRHWC
jgi:hypothetical protein